MDLGVRLADALVGLIEGFLFSYAGPRLLGFRPGSRSFIGAAVLSGLLITGVSELNRRLDLPLGMHTIIITVGLAAVQRFVLGLRSGVAIASAFSVVVIVLLGTFLLVVTTMILHIDMALLLRNPLWYLVGAAFERIPLALLALAVWRRGIVLFDATRDSPGLTGALALLDVFLAQSYALLFMGVLSAATHTPLWQSLPWGLPAWAFWGLVTTLPLAAVFLIRRLDDLHRAELAAVENEKMAELGRMSSMLAHEVRNPITSIKGWFQMAERRLAEGIPVDPIIAQAIEFGGQQSRHLEKLLSDFLVLGRMGGREEAPEEVDLARVIREVVEGARQVAAGRPVRVEAEVAPSLPRIRAVPQRLHQLLDNLVGNALDAVRGEGEVRVRAEVSKSGKHLVLRVADTGEGMPPHVCAQIFDPFFTTKEHGTGLGLVVVKRVAKELGARLDVKSAPDEGTEFVLRIPLAAQENGRDAEAGR